MESQFLVSLLALFLTQLSHAQYQTRPLNTGLSPNYNANPALIGNSGLLSPELQNPGFGNRALENAALRNTGLGNPTYGNSLAENIAFSGAHGNLPNGLTSEHNVGYNVNGIANGRSLADNMAFNGANTNLANRIALAEDVAFNKLHGNLANGRHLADNMAFSGVHSNLANRMALAEDTTFNGVHGSLANGMAISPSFSNMAGYSQDGVFTGGSFVVSSSSPLSPNGVNVQSDNLLVEGPLSITGQMPFLGVVSVEGGLPATGQGAVTYKCGNGEIGMVGENMANNMNGNYGFAGRPTASDRFTPTGLGMYTF